MKTRMIDVAENFKGQKGSAWCKMCFLFYECQEHLKNCSKIRDKLKGEIDLDFDYCDIQGPLHLQEKFAKSYTLILTTRETILQEMTPNGDQSTGGRQIWLLPWCCKQGNTRSFVTLPVWLECKIKKNMMKNGKRAPMVLNIGHMKKIKKIDPRFFSFYFLLWREPAFLPFSLSATVWPQMRNCQNFKNVGFLLKWAVEMPLTKTPKYYIPQKNKIILRRITISLF